MALKALQTRHSAPSAITRRSSLVCTCSKLSRPSSSSGSGSSSVLQRLPQQLATAALTASLLLSPVGAAEAAKAQQLADLLRDDYAFLDANKDGVVSRSEMQEFVKAVSGEANLPLVPEEQLEFTMKLYDLNQDGRTTSEEVLRAMVLDGAVDDDAVDVDVFDVFDKNHNGTVEAEEFRAGLGDLGQNGDAMKDYVFSRVNHVIGSDGKLTVGGFGNALVLVRNVMLGY